MAGSCQRFLAGQIYVTTTFVLFDLCFFKILESKPVFFTKIIKLRTSCYKTLTTFIY
jgi:hypothetical protein